MRSDTGQSADVAVVLALEPQVKALSEAIEAALPAVERLALTDEDAAFLKDQLWDSVADDCPMQGSIAAILAGLKTFDTATAA